MSQVKKLIRAFWETRERGIAVLTKDWTDEDSMPPLFYGEERLAFKAITPIPPRRFGERACYYMEDGELVFIVKPEFYPNIDFDKERVHVAGTFNNWEGARAKDWKLSKETWDGQDRWVLRVAPEKCLTKGKPALFKFVTEKDHWLEPYGEAPNLVTSSSGVCDFEIRTQRTGRHIVYFTLETPLDSIGPQELIWDDGKVEERCPVNYGYLLFQSKTDAKLGAHIEGGHTAFRLFAPRATEVTVHFSQTPDFKDSSRTLLEKSNPTTWEILVSQDLSGAYYYYTVDGPSEDGFSFFDPNFKLLDPYARATVGHAGPGIVLGPDRDAPLEDRFQPPAWQDLVILETHVRDLVAKAPIDLTDKERMGFSGLTKWLKDENCYLRTLGVNAVELQPVQEFDPPSAEVYHWGYMTNNYFSPASSYAQSPEKASQVEEFKDLVKSFHDAGIAVILDVVYNHVGESNFLLFIDKYYYFETNPEGDLMNWSGCGNDFRAHTPMGKRLIIDSLVHFVKTYNVDGFRFDLAELLGADVLREVEVALKSVKPSIILIAEPWIFGEHMALALKPTGFTSWNDGYRDFLKEYVLEAGNFEGLAYFMAGSTGHLSAWPAQTVNYTESHDDFCWIDSITENEGSDGTNPTFLDRRRTHLMLATLMASLGIPMLCEEQDMLRSKESVHNTYQRGDLNALDCQRAVTFSGTHAYFRRWIEFRLSHAGRFLRLDSMPSDGYLRFFQSEGNSALAVCYNADESRGEGGLLYAVNPHGYEVHISLKGLLLDAYVQIADHERINTAGLRDVCSSFQSDIVVLAPHSCALWEKR